VRGPVIPDVRPLRQQAGRGGVFGKWREGSGKALLLAAKNRSSVVTSNRSNKALDRSRQAESHMDSLSALRRPGQLGR
jgi:hypothetical protein